MFRNQIRGKRQQEQQDDLRGWLIATPAAEKTQGATVQPADNKPSQDTANCHLEEFNRRAADGKDHRAHRHRDSKFE